MLQSIEIHFVFALRRVNPPLVFLSNRILMILEALLDSPVGAIQLLVSRIKRGRVLLFDLLLAGSAALGQFDQRAQRRTLKIALGGRHGWSGKFGHAIYSPHSLRI
ncbi:MAG TPA: hypothetical protein VGP99_00310 [Tepidisphaeraceae bacterium]|nr:hypothetical protein [Tepidisphaeraceae bacterium]